MQIQLDILKNNFIPHSVTDGVDQNKRDEYIHALYGTPSLSVPLEGPITAKDWQIIQTQVDALCDQMQAAGFDEFVSLRAKFQGDLPNTLVNRNIANRIKTHMETIVYYSCGSNLKKDYVKQQLKGRQFACGAGTSTNLEQIVQTFTIGNHNINSLLAHHKDMIITNYIGTIVRTTSSPLAAGMEIHDTYSLKNAIADEFNVIKKSKDEDQYLNNNIPDDERKTIKTSLEKFLNSTDAVHLLIDAVAEDVLNSINNIDFASPEKEQRYKQAIEELELTKELSVDSLLNYEDYTTISGINDHLKEVIRDAVILKFYTLDVLDLNEQELYHTIIRNIVEKQRDEDGKKAISEDLFDHYPTMIANTIADDKTSIKAEEIQTALSKEDVKTYILQYAFDHDLTLNNQDIEYYDDDIPESDRIKSFDGYSDPLEYCHKKEIQIDLFKAIPSYKQLTIAELKTLNKYKTHNPIVWDVLTQDPTSIIVQLRENISKPLDKIITPQSVNLIKKGMITFNEAIKLYDKSPQHFDALVNSDIALHYTKLPFTIDQYSDYDVEQFKNLVSDTFIIDTQNKISFNQWMTVSKDKMKMLSTAQNVLSKHINDGSTNFDQIQAVDDNVINYYSNDPQYILYFIQAVKDQSLPQFNDLKDLNRDIVYHLTYPNSDGMSYLEKAAKNKSLPQFDQVKNLDQKRLNYWIQDNSYGIKYLEKAAQDRSLPQFDQLKDLNYNVLNALIRPINFYVQSYLEEAAQNSLLPQLDQLKDLDINTIYYWTHNHSNNIAYLEKAAQNRALPQFDQLKDLKTETIEYWMQYNSNGIAYLEKAAQNPSWPQFDQLKDLDSDMVNNLTKPGKEYSKLSYLEKAAQNPSWPQLNVLKNLDQDTVNYWIDENSTGRAYLEDTIQDPTLPSFEQIKNYSIDDFEAIISNDYILEEIQNNNITFDEAHYMYKQYPYQWQFITQNNLINYKEWFTVPQDKIQMLTSSHGAAYLIQLNLLTPEQIKNSDNETLQGAISNSNIRSAMRRKHITFDEAYAIHQHFPDALKEASKKYSFSKPEEFKTYIKQTLSKIEDKTQEQEKSSASSSFVKREQDKRRSRSHSPSHNR